MAEVSKKPAASWWWRFRQDLGLRIEHRGLVLSYLIVERGLKGLGLLVISFYLFAHIGSGLDTLITHLVEQFDLDSGSNLLKVATYDLVLRFVGISQTSLVALAAGSFLYGVIEAAESIGLVLKRRWAEYLVVLATAFFIPVEIFELARKPTIFKVATLVINVVVVIYLVRRKRLFRFDEPASER
ncbi:MAG: DUF2127 domain-containing protein [Candidatus Dormibacteria bacterium]